MIAAAIAVLRSGTDGCNWVAEVTRTAGAGKGTFYLYFPSWEEMLAVVREHLIEDCNSPIRHAPATREPVDWWAVLDEQCVRFVDVVIEFDRNHGLIFHSALPNDPDRESGSSTALLATALERGVADGCFGPVDVDIAARMLHAVVHTAADAVLEGGDRERWISACTRLARSYLAQSEERITPHPRRVDPVDQVLIIGMIAALTYAIRSPRAVSGTAHVARSGRTGRRGSYEPGEGEGAGWNVHA